MIQRKIRKAGRQPDRRESAERVKVPDKQDAQIEERVTEPDYRKRGQSRERE